MFYHKANVLNTAWQIAVQQTNRLDQSDIAIETIQASVIWVGIHLWLFSQSPIASFNITEIVIFILG